MIRHIFKGTATAFSLTLMLLAIVYTEQSRVARDTAPTRIGETYVAAPFLKDYADTRQELIIGFLRERFPALGLPEPEAGPVNSLSLEALHARAASQ